MNINDTIKKMNTANILLDAFGDGHEFTMHYYQELAATANELFGGRYSEDNPCYSVGWLREHYTAFGIEKVGSREVEVMTSHYAYERVRYNNTDMYYNKYVGRKYEPKTVKQFIYRMTNAQDCSNVINHYKEEIRCEVDRVTARIECDKQYLEKLKKMLQKIVNRPFEKVGGLLFNVSRETSKTPNQKSIVGHKILHERKTFVKR